jgi:hypothetical protein
MNEKKKQTQKTNDFHNQPIATQQSTTQYNFVRYISTSDGLFACFLSIQEYPIHIKTSPFIGERPQKAYG